MPFGQWDYDSQLNSQAVQNMAKYGDMSGPNPDDELERKAREQAQMYAFQDQYKRDTTPPTKDEIEADQLNPDSNSWQDVRLPGPPDMQDADVMGPAKIPIYPMMREPKPETKISLDNMMAQKSAGHAQPYQHIPTDTPEDRMNRELVTAQRDASMQKLRSISNDPTLIGKARQDAINSWQQDFDRRFAAQGGGGGSQPMPAAGGAPTLDMFASVYKSTHPAATDAEIQAEYRRRGGQ
jgi:hypothetical protein